MVSRTGSALGNGDCSSGPFPPGARACSLPSLLSEPVWRGVAVLCARPIDLDPSPYGLREKGREGAGPRPGWEGAGGAPTPVALAGEYLLAGRTSSSSCAASSRELKR